MREGVPSAEQHPIGAAEVRQVGDVDLAGNAACIDHQAFADEGIEFHPGRVQSGGIIVQRRVGMGA